MNVKALIAAAAIVIAGPASAATIVDFANFTIAASPTGLTPIVSFSTPTGNRQTFVSVTDCCIVGDYYATYVDGNYLGTTPFEPLFGSTLSAATFTLVLGGGAHNFQLVDQTTDLLPAGVFVQITSVPETATWVMMLAGFAGLGFAGYRRSRPMADA